MFIDTDCTIELQGKEFTNDGAYICECTDGKLRGMVYLNEDKRAATTWHGNVLSDARWTDYQGNFCNMRRVSFRYEGRNMIRDYCPDWSEVVKVRSTK